MAYSYRRRGYYRPYPRRRYGGSRYLRRSYTGAYSRFGRSGTRRAPRRRSRYYMGGRRY